MNIPRMHKILADRQTLFFTLPYRVWSSIVIVREKNVFFASFFFRNISKTAETILIKKIVRETMAFRSTKQL